MVLDELTLDAPAAAMVLRVHDGHLELLQDPRVEPVGALDQTMRFGRVEAGEAQTIGEVDDDGPLRDIAAALTSALQVGAAQRGLDMTVAYSLERVQFGRPIGSFQALKHRMADMLVLVEASRSASWGASAAAAAYVTDPTAANRDDPAPPVRRGPVLLLRRPRPRGLGDRPAARRHRDHLGARRPAAVQAAHTR